MNVRNIYNRFRLHRGAIALLLAAILLVIFALVGIAWIESIHWSTLNGNFALGLISAMSGCLVVLLVVINRQSILFEFKKTRGFHHSLNDEPESVERLFRAALGLT